MRYVQVKFAPWERRSYSYSYAGDEPIAEGDKVEVRTKDGLVEVIVDGVSDQRPPSVPAHIEIKPIERVLPREDAA